jgi:hypothetical protein
VGSVVFSTPVALREFEAATGVRLKASADSLAFKLFRRWHPQARLLPRVDLFESTTADSARFGGRFCVRVWHRDEPDLGLLGGELTQSEIERGPNAGQLMAAATARRANVEVMFWPDSNEVDAEAKAAWTSLTAFLTRL